MTGASGFIGSRLLELLRGLRMEIVVIDRRPCRIREDEYVKAYGCEAQELERLKTEVTEGFDICYHLAWGGVNAEQKNDIKKQLDNIEFAVKILELAHELECDRFLMTGSAAEYSQSRGTIDFSEKQTPADLYGASKTAAYFLMKVRAEQLQQKFIWAVLPGVYGENNTHGDILAYTVLRALEGKKAQYGNLDLLWEFLYVEDAARALTAAGESGIGGKVYGLGNGIHKPLRYYVDTTKNMIRKDLEIEENVFRSVRLGCCVDSTEFRVDTGFEAVCSFEAGMRKVVDWYRGNQDAG